MLVPPASSQQVTPPLGDSAAKLVKEVERGRSGWLDKLHLPAKTHYEMRYLNAAHIQQVVHLFMSDFTHFLKGRTNKKQKPSRIGFMSDLSHKTLHLALYFIHPLTAKCLLT